VRQRLMPCEAAVARLASLSWLGFRVGCPAGPSREKIWVSDNLTSRAKAVFSRLGGSQRRKVGRQSTVTAVVFESNNNASGVGNFRDDAVPLLLPSPPFLVVQVSDSDEHRLADVIPCLVLVQM
jgi:hypothetical protein